MTAITQLASRTWEYPDATGTALLLPGFLDGRSDPGIVALGDGLQAAGLSAVAVDPRGSGASPGTPADLGPTTQLEDIATLVRAAERMVLIGHCYGALLACLAAVQDPRVTDVVALMPSRCFIWPDPYDPSLDTWRGAGEHVFTRDGRRYRVPYSVVEDALRYDLPTALTHLRQRILFVAGEQDQLIGVGPVRELHAACGSTDKRLAVLPVQHDFREIPAHVDLVVSTVLGWITAG